MAFYLGIYAAFIVASIALDGVTAAVYANGAWLAARRLHRRLLQSVMHAPLAWWTSVPVGRVVNRFSRDLNSLDDTLSKVPQYFLGCLARHFFSLGAIASILPAFALPAIALCGVGAAAGEMYTRTAVTVKRLVSSRQSPVFSQFADTLAGLAVVRARAGAPSALTALFRTRAWRATKRGGPQQDLKVGFMPDDEGDSLGGAVPEEVRWDREGGFLMDGERRVYVHCGVRETDTSFAFTARPGYAGAIAEKVDAAAEIIAFILGK